ncbi:MAG: outer membrane protein assembly factor BamD [Desulfonatronovibrionaceae bacterium]
MNKILTLFIWTLILAGLSACTLLDRGPKPLEDSPWELAQAGSSAMEESRYRQAIKYFTDLKDKYPFSTHTPVAEVALGDAYFKALNYEGAVNSYLEFIEMNPRHELVPYALFRTGLANYSMFKTVDRPQTNMLEAVEYFNRVIESYPDTPYAEYSEYYIHQARKKQAEHELFVADFYWKSKRYGAAWKRYEYIIQNFQDLPEIQEYAAKRSRTSYFRYQQAKAKQKQDREQGSWKDWFSWL